MATKRPPQTPGRLAQRCYLAEVRLRVIESELSWIGSSLVAACLRLRGSGLRSEVLSAVYIPDEELLSCIVKAGCVEDVQRLFGVALLPSVRVVGAIVLAS
jgi:hypothetical protein